MLDIKLIRQNPDLFRNDLQNRGGDPSQIDRILEQDVKRRELITRGDDLKQQRNQVSKELGQKKKAGEDISEASAQMRKVGEEIDALDVQINQLEADQKSILECLPNPAHDSVPPGKDDQANLQIRTWGAVETRPDPLPKAHFDLGEELDIIDFKRAAKVSGSRFWVMKGAGARLERAIATYFLDQHTLHHGYTEILAPSLVQKEALYGTGQLPRFEEDLFKCQDSSLYLIPTSEVPITNLHAGEILEMEQLPIHYVGYSPCYRSEAGAAGRDSRGLIRVHQFHKVELVKFTTPETSFEELEKMVADAEKVLQGLEIPYRVVKVCLGDLGFTAALKYDIEFWSPAQQRYIEISSCSNCTDFQARRAGIRFRRAPKSGPEFVHTLNGSGLAVGRSLVAVLENHQQPDGSVNIPKVLQPYMGGLTSLTRAQLAAK
ncbi:serine--tRNA ligase [bacterium]|nr:serine--tRNA ligase [bacterium]